MSDSVYQELLETSWHRELTSQEAARLRAFLAEHPEAQADWQAEAALNGWLRRLPEPAVASNFTAQVMRAVQMDQLRNERPMLARCQSWLRMLWPKAAWAAAALFLGTAALLEHRHLDRARLARDLASITVAASTLPSPEILQDFDAVRQLSLVPAASTGPAAVSDDEFLAALQ